MHKMSWTTRNNGKFYRYDDSLVVSRVPLHAKDREDGSDKDQIGPISVQSSPRSHEKSKYVNRMMQGMTPKGDPARVEIVIHVCDEAKNIKQDFSCPRDLLVKEMRYFADYLSADIDRWEDVDISVHCDVQIFDWLMKYVKRFRSPTSTLEEGSTPQLEPTNVISILISSDFLKMDTLVQECIQYCHENMSAIIATPCNMNCISDKLVTRIADLFTPEELDAVKDKKDKFRSKLFCKKIEEMFDADFSKTYSPANCADLFKCIHCDKLLTSDYQSKVECIGSRTSIDNRGDLHYHHCRDVSWDVNDYIISLKSQLKYWRHVYWRLWGVVNYLHCSVCGLYFPCTEFKNCRFHPQPPVYTSNGANCEEKTSDRLCILGRYPCCDDPAVRFDPVARSRGCTWKEHSVKPVQMEAIISDSANHGKLSQSKTGKLNATEVIDLLQKVKDILCPTTASKQEERFPSTLCFEDIVRIDPVGTKRSNVAQNVVSFEKGSPTRYRVESSSPSRRKASRKVQQEDEEEDQSEVDEPTIVRVVINPAVKSRSHYHDYTGMGSWDVSLPVRLNQDVQREEDLKRMNDLLVMLSKERLDDHRASSSTERSVLSGSEYAGGVYHRLESQLKSSISSHRSQPSGTASASTTTGRGARSVKT